MTSRKRKGKQCASKGCYERALYSMNVNEKSCCVYKAEKSFLNSIFGKSKKVRGVRALMFEFTSQSSSFEH